MLDRIGSEAAGEGGDRATRRVLTVPNLISFGRILLIPGVVWLLVTPGLQQWGILVLGAVVATDWVDGMIARRTGQVSELGKVLDPTADRLVIAAGVVTLVVANAVPLWAALVVVVRDGVVLLAGAALYARGVRLDVRFLGKAATAMLMLGIPLIAWGNLGFALGPAALALGWPVFAVGVAESYLAAGLYARDAVRLIRARRGARSSSSST